MTLGICRHNSRKVFHGDDFNGFREIERQVGGRDDMLNRSSLSDVALQIVDKIPSKTSTQASSVPVPNSPFPSWPN